LNRVSHEAPGPTHKVHAPMRQGLRHYTVTRLTCNPQSVPAKKKIALFKLKENAATRAGVYDKYIHKCFKNNILRNTSSGMVKFFESLLESMNRTLIKLGLLHDRV